MLVLGRKAGQSVMVGDEIEVSVLRVDGDTVRIGFSAPEVEILRTELYRRREGERCSPAPSAAHRALALSA